jgi:CPA2 family monovalent cation:H+ antiporter-2
LIVTPLVVLFRYPIKTAIISGLGLAQIGEFSFVLAEKGKEFGLVTEQVYMLILGTTAITLIVTPFVLRLLPGFLARGESLPWLKSWLAKVDTPLEVAEDLPFEDHVIVCGYGRVGSNIVRLLRDRNYRVLVIEQSEQQIEMLRNDNIPYIYGNAASVHVLEKASISQAKGMAIALPDPMSSRLCLKRALKINPELDLVVRANENEDIELFYQLGAKEVVQPEFEASLELSTHLCVGLGLPLSEVQQDIRQIRDSHYLTLRPGRSKEKVSREIMEATKTMKRKWYSLPLNSPLVGKSLEEVKPRRLTGAVLVTVKRSSGEKLDYPDSQTTFCEGDKLLLVGEGDELVKFDDLAKGKIAIAIS